MFEKRFALKLFQFGPFFLFFSIIKKIKRNFKKLKFHSELNQSGQGILEYILLLIITVAIILGLLGKFITPFKNYSAALMQSRVECALEIGDLMDNESLANEGGDCARKFADGTWKGGSSGASSGGGSSGSSGSSSSGSSSGGSSSSSNSSGNSSSGKSSSGSSSSGSSSNSSSNSDNDKGNSGNDGKDASKGSSSSSGGSSSGNSSASSSGADNGSSEGASGGGRGGRGGRGGSSGSPKVKAVLGRNGKVEHSSNIGANDGSAANEVTISMDEGDESSDRRRGFNAFQKNRRRPKPIAFNGGVIEEEKKKKEEKEQGAQGRVSKGSEGNERQPKQIKIQASKDNKVKVSKEESWSLGEWLRYAIIALIILAILLFLFFQIIQFARGFDKK